ncbi:aminotransferase class III-fold pyridoxal phosphate-dependent enzyme [bacterium]|nr:aminotransferase class III-fold pyridoxal phosphate-dependent enzyme [bacterium]
MEHVYNCTVHETKIPNIVDSQGVYLFDEHGKRFMDLESGVWCASIGHKNDRINRIIKKQIDSIMHAGFCYSSQVLEESAKSVLNITNFINGKCVFLCSGSEAIEISRQIARHITGKKLSMTFHDSYLGAYRSVADRTTGWYLFNWDQCKTCDKKDNCDPTCDALRDIPEDISDFVFEPGSSSGFVRFPPKTLVQNIVNIVRNNSGKVIVNEVTTGVGRTGKWFGFQHYDIEPDLIAIGKGIGNGYPVSVAAINQTTMHELEAKPFTYAQSHQNDPLGAAVVGEVIHFIEDNDLIAEADRKGAVFFNQLESLVDNEIILNVRGRGLMLAVDMVNAKVGNEIFNDLIDKGYIVGNRNAAFRIDPPLTLTETEFDGFIDTFKSLITAKKFPL